MQGQTYYISVDLVIVNNAISSPTGRGIMIILLFDYKYFGRHAFSGQEYWYCFNLICIDILVLFS